MEMEERTYCGHCLVEVEFVGDELNAAFGKRNEIVWFNNDKLTIDISGWP
jgi:hypothetical protein